MFQIDNKAPDADMVVVQTDDGHVTISRDDNGDVHIHATSLSRGQEQYAVLGHEGVSEGWGRTDHAEAVVINQCMPELPDREDVEITLEVEHDADLPVRGNVQASGDDAADRAAETEVLNRVARGDVWAWACVTVVGRWRGYEAAAVLGGCSYENEAQFRDDSYFDDLVSEVVDKIQQEADLRQRLDHIEERTRQLAQAHDATAVRKAIDRMLDVYKYVVRAEHNR